MTTILVTGSNGQLGSCLKDIEESDLNIIYTDYQELDICDLNEVNQFFQSHGKIDYCINCAAYTAVDNAEKEQDRAYQINALGPKHLALVCKAHDTTLIHISTDFVFDGTKTTPYKEIDLPNPLSVYGESKLLGEEYIQSSWSKHIIIRTSWLYSPFGDNFLKTMLRLSTIKTELSVVNDQIGTPTNAYDLSKTIIQIVFKLQLLEKKNENIDFYGIYHFSNEGVCSWYDFAKEIFRINNIKIDLRPITALNYPTPAKRPMYSVLDKSRIKVVFGIHVKSWEESLLKINIK